jgi:dTMP kinase
MKQNSMLICFTGIDGSGKTTQAKSLVERLKSKGVKSEYAWSRGEVLTIRRFFLFLGRKALGTSTRQISNDESAYHDYQSRKSILMRNSIVRILWSITTCIEHLVQINWSIRRKLQNGNVIVCDRYLWDSIIDMAVLNHKNPEYLTGGLYRFITKLVPTPTSTFLIDIAPEEAFQRKNDIPSIDYVKIRADFYRYLAHHVTMNVINGCSDIASIQNQIDAVIMKKVSLI